MGKHNAPSQLRPRLVRAGTLALAITGPIVLNTGTANAVEETSVLEVIAHCESGNSNVNTRGGSTASGYLQILDSTWKAFGGKEFASRAINASRAEQFIVGQRILAGQGISAWSPSRSCWGSKISTTKPKTVITPEPKKFNVDPPKKITPKTEVKKVTPPTPKKKVTTAVAPTPTPTRTTAKKVAASYLIKRGDTLSKIAKKNGTTWRTLFAANRDTVRNPNLIYTGNHLRLR
jgi:LysM repeat protein